MLALQEKVLPAGKASEPHLPSYIAGMWLFMLFSLVFGHLTFYWIFAPLCVFLPMGNGRRSSAIPSIQRAALGR